MSNDIDNPPPYRDWSDVFPIWLRVTAAICVTSAVAGFAILTHTKELGEGVSGVRAWWVSKNEIQPSPLPPVQNALQLATPEQSQQKKAESLKAQLPCFDDPADIYETVRDRGSRNKFEAKFNLFFGGREACIVLPLTDAGTMRLRFVISTDENWPPTFHVKPMAASDLKKYKPGTRLRVRGDLVRYVDTAPGQPDEIYIDRARITEVSDADGSLTTGSLRK